MKKNVLILFAALFLAACASDTGGGKDQNPPEVVVTQEVRSRAELLSQFYTEWKSKVDSVAWAHDDPETLKLAEAFILGDISHFYLMQIREESLLQILEVFQILPNGDPKSPEMLKLAQATLSR